MCLFHFIFFFSFFGIFLFFAWTFTCKLFIFNVKWLYHLFIAVKSNVKKTTQGIIGWTTTTYVLCFVWFGFFFFLAYLTVICHYTNTQITKEKRENKKFNKKKTKLRFEILPPPPDRIIEQVLSAKASVLWLSSHCCSWSWP